MLTRLALALWFGATPAIAEMYVDRSIVTFDAQSPPRQDVKVSNTGSDVMYVQVDVRQIRDPGTEREEALQITDPKALKLIATPAKLVIPAGGQKLIRIVNLEPRAEAERIYRINVTPVLPPLSENTSQLRIVVAYQILTIVQPAEPSVELTAQRTGQTIRFLNSGTSNVLLSEGSQCSPAATADCKELPSRRLYAGNAWELQLPFDAPLTYSVRTFDGIRTQVFE
jgi:P pilus assembly chaperone PapD